MLDTLQILANKEEQGERSRAKMPPNPSGDTSTGSTVPQPSLPEVSPTQQSPVMKVPHILFWQLLELLAILTDGVP